jgi:hypothetical protein
MPLEIPTADSDALAVPLNIATSNIVALAFGELRVERPAGFSDGTRLGQETAVFYAQARDEVLEQTDWPWASWQADLPAVVAGSGGRPTFDPALPYLFAIPPNCLALRAVGDSFTRWQVEGVWLRSNAPAPLRVRYTRRIENEEQIPASARSVMALRLARLLLPSWGDTEDRRRVDDAFEAALATARRAAARTASVQTWTGQIPSDIIGEAIQ